MTKCTSCQAELQPGWTHCPMCGHAVAPTSPTSPGHPPALEDVMAEVAAATRGVGLAVTRLSGRVLRHTERALDHPSDSARGAAKKVVEELQKAEKELEDALREL